MSQAAITLAFEKFKAQEAAGGRTLILDEFVLANVPGLDPSAPVDRSEGLPPTDQIVHRQAVNTTGVVNEHAVAYSITMGTEVGDFDFNWLGLVNKATGLLAMVVHVPTQRKIANTAGQQGNALTRSFLMEFDGAAAATGITTPAETWQIDFTARLHGVDEMQRLANRDLYGAGAFFGDGFLVVRQGAGYTATAGVGYIGGLRAELTGNKPLSIGSKPTKVWADVSLQGNVTSAWETVVALTVAETMVDYVDQAGFAHYVFAVAGIDAAGSVTDLRPKGSTTDQASQEATQKLRDDLDAHVRSRNHPDATLADKGFVRLYSGVDSSDETKAATPKAVKIAMDNANARLAKERNLADLPNPALARQSLQLGDSATKNMGTTAGTIAAGDDVRITGAMQKDKNGEDIPDKGVFLKNIGLPELLDKKFDKTGGEVDGEITSTGIVRANNVSTIELNPNESRPRLTSRVGKDGEWYSSYLQQKTGTIAHLDDIPAATNIVQGTGQSTTSVISQKGVTDALSAHGIGYGQQYMNMTGNRQVGSWYPNNTGRPIFIIVFVGRDYNGGTEESAADINFLIGSEVISIPMIRGANSGGAQRDAGSALIPDGAIYTVTTAFGSEIKTWWELR